MDDREEQPASAAAIDRPVSTARLVLLLGWPVLVQQFLILFVNLSDFFLAGHFRPDDPSKHVAYQAAQTTASYLDWLIICFTVFVTVGSTALVARFVGARDRVAAVRATNQSITLAIAFGLIGTVVGIAGVESFVRALGLTGDAAEFCVSYLRPIFALLVFQVIEQAGIACLIGAGDTRMGLYLRGGVALVNLPLAWVLYLSLGFQGIALGTAIGHTLGAIAVLIVLSRGRAGLRLHLSQMWPDWRLQWRLLRVSLPAGADSMSIGIGHLWFLTLVNALGDEAATAHGIALKWEAMGYLSGVAFGTAAMALVGQNLGAGRPDRAARSGWTAFGMGLAVMVGMGTIFFSLAPLMFRLFAPNPEQRHVIELGVPVLRLVAFAMPAVACTIIFPYALRGAGDTRVPVLFTWFGFLGVRIPLAYWLTQPVVNLGPFGMWQGGLFGAWLAMFADLYVRGAMLLARYAGGRWQSTKV